MAPINRFNWLNWFNWFNRQANIMEFTLSSLLRRKGRNAALVLVYTAVVFVLASVMFFTHSIKEEAALLLEGAPEIVVQKMVAGRHDLMPAAYAEAIRNVRGVSHVKGRLWGYYYDPLVEANYTLMAPEGNDPGKGNVAIGSGISRSRRAYEGDLIPLKAHDGAEMNFRIKEILSARSELVSADLMLLSEDDFRVLFGIPQDRVTDLAVGVANPAEVITVARKVAEALPDTRPILREEILRTYEAVFNWRGGLMVVVLAASVLAFIILAWDKASGLSAEERREIGVLKAIGWETSEVLRMKFFEGAAVSLSSFLMGIIAAYAHVYLADSAFFAPVLKGWSVLYPEFKLMPSVDFHQLAALFFLTVMPYTAATIVPSWRAATTDPDAIMRT